MKRLAFGIGGVVVVMGLFALTVTGERLSLAAQDQGEEAEATATRAAELDELERLRAEVAELQTRVAELTTDAEPDIQDVLTGDCGPPAAGWGAATAGSVQGNLVAVEVEMPLPEEAPAGTVWVTFELELASANAALPAVESWVFTMTTCEGNAYEPEAVVTDPIDIDSEDTVTGLVAFAVPSDEQPVLLSLRIEENDRCQAELRFPLTMTTEPVATPPAGACEGPTATAGVSTSGRDGGHGGNAVGGDAIGGDGCPGGDAVGGDAVGGDGGDGGDAVGGDAVGGDAIGGDCPNGEGS